MSGYQPLAAVIESVQEVQQQERTGELDGINLKHVNQLTNESAIV